MATRTPKKNGIQGEGDYISARRFDEEERRFVKSGKVARKAREAAQALEGPEGPELERARRVSARGKSLPKPSGATARQPGAKTRGPDRGVDNRLDEGLEETFPASDPVSISPGSD